MSATYLARGRVVWPIRPNVEKVTRVIELGQRQFIISLEFPPQYFLPGGIQLPGSLWSQVTVCWRQPFMGTEGQARKWVLTAKGESELLKNMERAQNAFVDILKYEFPGNYDVHCIRHFGPLDWPLYVLLINRVQLVLRMGSSLGSQFKTIATPLDSLAPSCGHIAFEQRTLQRAVDLAQCGYPTESVLLAAAVLDATVQRFLKALMEQKHIRADAADQLLRNVMTRRLATYLDAVLKLASARSLSDDKPALFKRLIVMNQNRNDAIHNGKELTRLDAYEACTVVFEVIAYLHSIEQSVFQLPRPPAFFA